MINKYAIGIAILIVFIIMFVILTSEEKIERWKNKISAFSSLAILATISIFLLNYISDEGDRERQMKLDLIEIMDKRLNDVDKLFMQHKELNALYDNIYYNKSITDEYYNKPIVQQMLSIMIRNIDDYNFLTNYSDTDIGLDNTIKKWFSSDVILRFYNENRHYYSKDFERYITKMLNAK